MRGFCTPSRHMPCCACRCFGCPHLTFADGYRDNAVVEICNSSFSILLLRSQTLPAHSVNKLLQCALLQRIPFSCSIKLWLLQVAPTRFKVFVDSLEFGFPHASAAPMPSSYDNACRGNIFPLTYGIWAKPRPAADTAGCLLVDAADIARLVAT